MDISDYTLLSNMKLSQLAKLKVYFIDSNSLRIPAAINGIMTNGIIICYFVEAEIPHNCAIKAVMLTSVDGKYTFSWGDLEPFFREEFKCGGILRIAYNAVPAPLECLNGLGALWTPTRQLTYNKLENTPMLYRDLEKALEGKPI